MKTETSAPRQISRLQSDSESNEDFPRLLELSRCVAAQTRKARSCAQRHYDNLRAQGETERRLRELEHWRGSSSFTARERAALSISEAFSLWRPDGVGEDVLKKARRHLDPSEMVRLTLAVAAVNDWIDFHESAVRVLVVEDSSADQELLRIELNKTHLAESVIFVSNASEALDLLIGAAGDAFRRDLIAIFLDLNLPGMTGIEFLQRIRIIPDMKHFPVIIMTSSNHPDDIEECRRLEVSSYVQKPVTFETFAKAVANIFHSVKAEQAVTSMA